MMDNANTAIEWSYYLGMLRGMIILASKALRCEISQEFGEELAERIEEALKEPMPEFIWRDTTPSK